MSVMRVLASHLSDGGRPLRVLHFRQNGDVWEVDWRLHDRLAGRRRHRPVGRVRVVSAVLTVLGGVLMCWAAVC